MPNNRFERCGAHLRWAKEGVDDWDKSASDWVGEAPRRSSATLGAAPRTKTTGHLS
jgi:hypothetical protein